jgi:hypothetical protein
MISVNEGWGTVEKQTWSTRATSQKPVVSNSVGSNLCSSFAIKSRNSTLCALVIVPISLNMILRRRAASVPSSEYDPSLADRSECETNPYMSPETTSTAHRFLPQATRISSRVKKRECDENAVQETNKKGKIRRDIECKTNESHRK